MQMMISHLTLLLMKKKFKLILREQMKNKLQEKPGFDLDLLN